MLWGAFKNLVLVIVFVLIAGCGGGGGGGSSDSDSSGSGSSGSSSGSGSTDGSGSGSSGGDSFSSDFNPYLPISSDITLFYNNDDRASRFDGHIERNNHIAHVLSFPAGDRQYFATTPDDIYLLGFFSDPKTIGDLGEFVVDVRLNDKLLLWNPELPVGNAISINIGGSASITPAYGEHEVVFSLNREYVGTESVATPFGQMAAQVIHVSATVQVTLEGIVHDLYWDNTYWFVKGVGLARLEASGDVSVLTAVNGPDTDGDGIPDLIDVFPEDSLRTFDTDGDGLANEDDPDDDGDGAGDATDAFPLDVLERRDTDGDGAGDRADTDDDGDSIADGTDAFPQDAMCWLPGHTQGDGRCDTNPVAPMFAPDAVFADESGIVYLFSESRQAIFRWSAVERRFLNPIYPSGAAVGSLVSVVYLSAQNRLYLGYDSGSVTYIALSDSMLEENFTYLFEGVDGLSEAGNYLMVRQSTSYSRAAHIFFDAQGNQAGADDWNYHSNVYAWNTRNSRLYFFRDGISPNDLHYQEIDQASGQVLSEGESPYHGDYTIAPPIRISTNGEYIALGSGDLYDADNLTWQGAVGRFGDALWLDNGELVLVRQDGDGISLERRAAGLAQRVEVRAYSGSLHALLRAGSANLLVTSDGSGFQFHEYVPDNDSDGDGIENLEDAFPLDPAASLDSDNDGYPDSWNAGYSEGDSTSGLTLDQFPADSACWLEEHDDGSGQCDFAATMPQFTPDEIVADDGGVIYLFSSEHGAVYRWSAEQGGYLNPIYVGADNGLTSKSPNYMAHSPAHGRLYFGYDTGEISYVDLTGDLVERSFTSTSMAVRGLAAVGNYILAQDDSGAWATHYIFDVNGALTDSEDWNYYSDEYAWSAQSSRVFFNSLRYEEIDQNSGTIVAEGQAGTSNVQMPLRISTDGTMIVTGGGDFFDTEELLWLGKVEAFSDAIWLDDGQLVTVLQQSGEYRIKRISADLTTTMEMLGGSGTVLGFRRAGDFNIIVTQLDGELLFTEYLPNDDSDSDGIENLEDDFPTDVAASLDTDRDGYPDSWNDGYSELESTTGLVLDTFPLDSACWSAAHDDGSGQCDYGASVPDFTPTKVIADHNGILYLFSHEYRTVFRWSVESQSYLNPLIVGDDNGWSVTGPSMVEYSESHRRLYFGYDSGELTYIDVDAGAEEQRFGQIWSSIDGLAAAGDFLLVLSQSGGRMAYVLDVAGQVVETDGNYYLIADEYAWSASDSRLYHVQSNSSSGVRFTEIDQSTGETVGYGSSPYYSGIYVNPPLRLSNDGARLIVGAGYLFDTSDLTWQGSVDAFDDAVWLVSGELVMLTQQGPGFRLVRRDASLTREVEVIDFSGELVAIRQAGSAVVIVSRESGGLVFTSYVPNDDSDGDGVPNTEDAFPLDVAASVDSDLDGYPDGWNVGYSAEDSTTGLILDAFPEDAACWLTSHDDGSGQCDYAAIVPDFTPDAIVADGNGIVYLLSTEHRAVYRWSAESRDYLNPIFVGEDSGFAVKSPSKMAYSPEHGRLYFGYSSGEITFVDLAGDAQEVAFASIPLDVRGLASVGNYVLAQDSSGAWYSHYIFDVNGVMTASAEWNRYSREYAWNDRNSRVYFFRDGTSPNDLHYEEINQSTGTISDDGETPYHSSAYIRLPIRVINDGSQVLLGSGKIYDATTLELSAAELPDELTDALDLGELLATARFAGDQWVVDLYSYDGFEKLMSFPSDYQILRIVRYDGDIVVVEKVDGGFDFSIISLGDSDSDGMPVWWELRYGLSDEDNTDAVTDLDTDGLTNLEEYNQGTDPLLGDTDADGLADYDEVYSHSTLPDEADSDSDGLSDGDEVLLYFTDPLKVDTDSDTFSDSDELFKYNSDPTDAASVPDAIVEFHESFEAATVPITWEAAAANGADWHIVTDEFSNGSQSIRSGAIGHNQSSSVVYSGLFSAGTLRFDAMVEAESCCDRLRVFIDGTQMLDIRSSGWTQYYIEVDAGEHEIEWRYTKDSSVDSGRDAAWIDDVSFGP